MKTINLVISLKFFILFTIGSFLFAETFSFAIFSFFMIYFSYMTNKADTLYKEILYSYWIKRSLILFSLFLALQIAPLPSLLLKKMSGTSYKLLTSIYDAIPDFHSISIIPYETFFFMIELLILFLFGYSLFILKLNKNEIVLIIEIFVYSIILKVILSGISFYFQKNSSGLQNYLLSNKELRFSLLLIFPLILGLIFFRVDFLKKSISISERFKLLCSNTRYWSIYILGLLIALFSLIIFGSKLDMFISFFSIVVFFSISFYLKQNKTKKKLLKPLLFISLIIFFTAGLIKTNNSPDIKEQKHKIFKSSTLSGIGLGTSKFIAPSLLNYNLINSEKKMMDFDLSYYELGIIGLLTIGTSIFLIILSLLKMWRIRKHPDVKILVLGLLCALGCVLISGFIVSIYQIRFYRFTTVLLLTITFKLLFYKRDFF